MGFFNQFKMASDMLKGMSPEQIQQMMDQAKESQKMLDEQIRKIVDEEIKKRGLVTKEDVELLIKS